MQKFYKILFFNSMMIGTLISISSYSWFSMWMGLEINLLSIIPLFKSKTNMFPIEATLKYFITQALASSIILFSIIMSLTLVEITPNNLNYWLMMILNSALLTKLGAAPFHAWFPEVAEGLNWLNNLILLTWQKLAPMILVMYNLNMTQFFSIIIISSSLISGIMGINQTSFRKILAYSSINHISWMLASMMTSKKIWMIYFLTYSLISMNIIMLLYLFNIYTFMQLSTCINSNKKFKMMFVFNFYSLGGLPPFLGFFPKWLVINFLIMNNFFILSAILIISTLVTLFFYIRISLSTLTFYHNENLVKFSKINNFITIFFNMISLMGLITCTIFFSTF